MELALTLEVAERHAEVSTATAVGAASSELVAGGGGRRRAKACIGQKCRARERRARAVGAASRWLPAAARSVAGATGSPIGRINAGLRTTIVTSVVCGAT